MPRVVQPTLPAFPRDRLRHLNATTVQGAGQWVVYWMHAVHRLRSNFALERAAAWARTLQKPLLIAETLASDSRWGNIRHHRFVLEGMAELQAECKRRQVAYYPFVERKAGQVTRLLATLARSACVVVADDFPLRRQVADTTALASVSPVLVEAVDSNGLLPLRAADRTFTTAHAFRRFLQRTLPGHLVDFPAQTPLRPRPGPVLPELPEEITRRWPVASAALLAGERAALARLPIEQQTAPVETRGGPQAAQACLRRFLSQRLARYLDERNVPDAEATSGLSPYLHHGHLSVHDVFTALAEHEGWTPDRLAERPTGSREHWWGMSPAAEAFLDELVTWREIGFNRCSREADYDAYETLPDWAQATLAKHAGDRRAVLYAPDALEAAETHDPLWNAAQRQLLREGRVHNYLRMLWGKKILQWSPSPQQALEVMEELNNRYALDGDDPNSYSGIFWVLGRYDRAWGPERPVFGTVRYLSSENTCRKLRIRDYLARYGPEA